MGGLDGLGSQHRDRRLAGGLPGPRPTSGTGVLGERSARTSCWPRLLPHMSDGSSRVHLVGGRPEARVSSIPAYDSSKAPSPGRAAMSHSGSRPGRPGQRHRPPGSSTRRSAAGRRRGGRAGRGRNVPLGRQGTAWEVAAPVVFLLSDDAAISPARSSRGRRRAVRRSGNRAGCGSLPGLPTLHQVSGVASSFATIGRFARSDSARCGAFRPEIPEKQ